MRRLVALALALASSDVGYRAPEHVAPAPAAVAIAPIAAPLDVRACTLDLGPGAAMPQSLAELPAERGAPPPVSTRIALADHATTVATAATLSAALPARWRPHVELDTTGMATHVQLEVLGEHKPNELVPDVLAFVRAHPCLFGVTDPKALVARASEIRGPWVLIDQPGSFGAIQAEVVADHGVTRVRIDQHLWPIARPPIAIDPNRVLAHYLGLAAHLEIGTRYLVDPKTRQHTGCVPMFKDEVTTADSFALRAPPLLVCRDRIAAVTAGAYVVLPGMPVRVDPVLKELPAALDPTGAVIARPWIVPAERPTGEDNLEFDVGACPMP